MNPTKVSRDWPRHRQYDDLYAHEQYEMHRVISQKRAAAKPLPSQNLHLHPGA